MVAWLLPVASSTSAVVILAGTPDETGSFANLAFAFFLLPYALVGALVASRRPGNAIGWLFVGGSTLAYLGSATFVLSAPYAQDATWGQLAIAVAIIAMPLVNVGFGLLITFLLLLFPDGHLVSRRWRPVAWSTGVVVVVLALTQPFADKETVAGHANPLVTWEAADTLGAIHGLANGVFLPAVVMASVASLVVRYRRSRGIERLQLRWFLFVAAAMVATLVVTGVLPALQQAGDIIGPIVFAALPITVAIAILRHRLYEIDVLIRRTLVYGALSVTLAAVYAGLVIVLQGALSELAGGDTLAVAASTLAVAALFQPARRRIKTAVDRRFYRSRYDAQRTAEGFSASLRHEVDMTRLAGDLAAVAGDALQPVSISVWIQGGHDSAPVGTGVRSARR